MQANEQRFLFVCSGFDAGTFDVARFSGIDTVSAPYRFSVTLTSQDPNIDGNAVTNKKATLFLRRGDQFFPYSGIVTSFKYLETTVDHSVYNMVLQPSLWILGLTVQSRIFLKKSVPVIIEQVLKDAGLGNYYSLDLQSYPEREYTVQYQESDLAFMSRLMEECGIWYFFKEPPLPADSIPGTVTNEKLVITDKGANFKGVAGESVIKYRSKSGIVDRDDNVDKETVYRFVAQQQVIPEEVVVKNYNYRTPELDLGFTSKISEGNSGLVYRYGGAYKNTSDAQNAAAIMAHRYKMEQRTFTGSDGCPGFKAGNRFTLQEHPRTSLNAEYVLTRVVHHGATPSFFYTKNQDAYRNEFKCIPSELAAQFVPDRTTPQPKIPGVMTAMIEAGGSEYAALDDQGRYKVRMPFDRADSSNFNASKSIRLAQPYSGQDYGIHFPSHEGAEMIIGHIDGDPDKPLGLGTVPNANTISPVRANNQKLSVIRTAGKNEIVIDDTQGAERIAITTPHDLSFTAQNDETVTVGNNRTKTVSADETDTIKGNLTVSVDQNYSATIKQNSTETVTQNKTVTVDGTHTETIKGATSITISDGSYNHTVGSGTATCTVQGDLTETYNGNQTTTVANKIDISSTGSSLHLTAATDLKLSVGASNLELFQDGTIRLTGSNIEIAATGELKMEGSGSVNISGDTILSNGTTTNTVNGGVVLVNT